MPKFKVSPTAGNIPFLDEQGLFNENITDVELALDNIRQQRVSQLDIRDTDSESSYTLTFDDNTFHAAIGSGSGYFFILPDATTCLTGQEFEIYNNSSNQLEVRDDSGTPIIQLNSTDLVRFVLEDNTTTDGNWLLQVATTTAAGIQSYSVGSITTFSTSSSTDVIVTGLTVTPVSGRYALWYSADITIGSNNRIAECVVFVDGVVVEGTRRDVQGTGSNYRAGQQTIAEVSVDGTEAVDIRVNVSSGSLTVAGRRLLLIRLGS